MRKIKRRCEKGRTRVLAHYRFRPLEQHSRGYFGILLPEKMAGQWGAGFTHFDVAQAPANTPPPQPPVASDRFVIQ